MDPALDIIRVLLEQDTTLWNSTVLLIQKIFELLGLWLHNTYFSFQNQIYKQAEGVAKGSPVSPIVANLYLENYEKNALHTSASFPRLWMRCVDDIFVIQREDP